MMSLVIIVFFYIYFKTECSGASPGGGYENVDQIWVAKIFWGG